MKHSRFALASATIIAIVLAGPASAGPEEEAAEVVQEWAEAFNASDVKRIVALYTPEATVHGTLSPDLASGSDDIRTYFEAPAKNKYQVRLQDSKSSTITEDVVVQAGYYTFSGTRPGGEPFEAQARYSFVVVNESGEWRIAHHHSSPRPKPPQ